jgi:MFS family permease
MLFFFYVLALLDRQVLGLLAESIKHQLHVSDVQLSFLLGLSFAIFYSGCAIPAGWLVDHKSRRLVVFAGVLIWSLGTCASAFARNYLELFLCRMAVGLGEAVLAPAAYSMISDAVPRRQIGTAISLYTSGSFVGYFIAFAVGGWALQAASHRPVPAWLDWGPSQPWQKIFLLAGIPGVIGALPALLLREPKRRGRVSEAGDGATFAHLLAFVARNWPFWVALLIAFSAMNAALNSVLLWVPSYMRRHFHWAPQQFGLGLALVTLAGFPGQMAVGWLIDRLRARGAVRPELLVYGGAVLIGTPLTVAAFLVADPITCLVLLSGFYFFLISFQGVAAIIVQQVTPNEFRGRLMAIYLFVTNAVGFGAGPTIVALLTERVFKDEARLNLSLAILVLGCAVIALLFLTLAARSLRRRPLASMPG